MLGALQFHVVNPKRYAIPSYGGKLPAIGSDSSLDDQVPIWNASLQCLIDDARNGGRVLADAMGKAWGARVEHLGCDIGFGGWKGSVCPIFIIYMHRTILRDGGAMGGLNRGTARALAMWLCEQVDADYVVASNYHKGFAVEVSAPRGTEVSG